MGTISSHINDRLREREETCTHPSKEGSPKWLVLTLTHILEEPADGDWSAHPGHHLCTAEVHQLDITAAGGGKDDVVRLQVQVAVASPVDVRQGIQHLYQVP